MFCRSVWRAVLLVMALASLVRGVNVAQMEQSVGDKVYCLCGCVTTLNHCPHTECAFKADARALIAKDAEEGKTDPAILQDLVDRYGEKVLAAPRPQGFNLTAWVLPGLGMLIGLIVAIAFVRRWRRPAPESADPIPAVDEKLRARVEEEIKKLAG
jgi:cytochrome c-type biogenesis protein CcmH/NrfF